MINVGAILLVSSEPEVAMGYCDRLEALGHSVLHAHSSRTGLRRLREGGIDAVVIDHAVHQSLQALINGMEQLPDPPPVVLISGDVEAPGLSARIGAADFIPKPCSADDFTRSLVRFL